MQQNNLYPFLWITGENTDNLVQEIDAIYESDVRGFCVESRTCADFCGKNWWNIMDTVLFEAKRRGMQVWLLDDKHYPTGFANEAIKNKYPDLRPWRISCEFLDVEGEPGEISLLLNSESDKLLQEKILGVFAVKMRGNKAKIVADLSDKVDEDYLSFAFDGKPLRVCTIKETRGGSESASNPYYLDMLNPASTDVLIREVYEPHYERYVAGGEYAGTFCGFFSDEPRFHNGYNCGELCCRNAYQSTLGIEGMSYPWIYGFRQKFTPRELLSLWWDTGESTSEIRIAYMDAITAAYSANFSGRLAAWCHARNITYCGHIIEDMGAHTRLGCSAGHYFRSQTGADYAAIDVVLHQIKPYYTKTHFAPIAGGYANPVFFDYTLAKLASSCARLYPEKNGKALCEIFGAYGWGESVNEMLYLVNHMLVRGINAFIPHAYSQTFPNVDCPPHFGKNTTLFGGYKLIMQYMKKMCELFAHEKADIKVAVLYHAEAEWSGKRYMPVDMVIKALFERQIDCDILPSEKLEFADNYEYIIVPYAEFLPEKIVRKLKEVKGTKVVEITKNSGAEITKIADKLPRTLCVSGKGAKRIRVMKFSDKDKFFLHNEGCETATVQAKVGSKYIRAIDALTGGIEQITAENGQIMLSLCAGQAVFMEYTSEIATVQNGEKIRNIPFEKAGEDEMSITYVVCAKFGENERLIIDFSGEFARVKIGEIEQDFIGGIAVINGGKNVQNTTIKVYKNLAKTMRDDLSKFSVLRPARLNGITVKNIEKG